MQHLISAQIEAHASGSKTWGPDLARFERVVLKLARGTIAYEVGEVHADTSVFTSMRCIPSMSRLQLNNFLTLPQSNTLPEVGSRAFFSVRLVAKEVLTLEGAWTVVQQGRFEYAYSYTGSTIVRMIVRGLLACHVEWV